MLRIKYGILDPVVEPDADESKSDLTHPSTKGIKPKTKALKKPATKDVAKTDVEKKTENSKID